jgi:hypothetical protein
MAKIVAGVETQLAPESAFAYIADFANQAEWDPNTVSSERIDETELGPGSRFVLKVKAGPRVLDMEYRITEFEPGSRVVLVGEGSGVWSEDDISFAGTSQGTRVMYAAELKLGGVLRVLNPILPRFLASLARGVREGMKRELDARAAPAS